MSNAHLLLWLEAPLQSWGFDSKFGRRDTLNFPTKSGLLGLLCCALGAAGEQKELLAIMSKMQITILAFIRKNEHKIPFQEPLLHDFHMVGSGYDDLDPWQSLLIPKKSNGKKANTGGSKITHRYYLQDMNFAAVLEVPDTLANTFAEALKNPAWNLYLGRKSCIPTDYIFRETYSIMENAIKAALQIAFDKNLVEIFRVLDGEHEGERLILNDIPIQFGTRKLYRERRVTVIAS